MLRATDKITALYCRLSVEDTKDEKKNSKEDLSNSIQNQKAMLLQYARDHRFPTRRFLLTTVTAVLPMTVLVFRKCLMKLKPVMWMRSLRKTYQGLGETPL